MARYYLITLFFFTLNYHCMRRAQAPRPPAHAKVSRVSFLGPDALKELLTELTGNPFIREECLKSVVTVPMVGQWWSAIERLRPGLSHRSVAWRDHLEQFPNLFKELILEIIGHVKDLNEEGESCNLEEFTASCVKLSVFFRLVYANLNSFVKKEFFVKLAVPFKLWFGNYICEEYPDSNTEIYHRDIDHGVPCLWCLGKATNIPVDSQNRDLILQAINEKTTEYRVKMIFECILINIVFSLWDATTSFFKACLDKFHYEPHSISLYNLDFAKTIVKLDEIVGYFARINSDFYIGGILPKLEHSDQKGLPGLEKSFCRKISYSIRLMRDIDFGLGQDGGGRLPKSDASGPTSPVTCDFGPIDDDTSLCCFKKGCLF